MSLFYRLVFSFVLLVVSPFSFCANCDCCDKMGGIRYCDSSAGRFVCNNGFYSSCYCDRHAVMDLQFQKGCCLWQGGVSKVDDLGFVICNDGGISSVCSVNTPNEKIVLW